MSFEDGYLIQIPTIFGQYNDNKQDWEDLLTIRPEEDESLGRIIESIIDIYIKVFKIDSTSFNIIKRTTKGTKSNIELFSILSDLKQLYKRFNR